MVLDPWLPIGYRLHDGVEVRTAIYEGQNWQIFETYTNGRALIAREVLARRWIEVGLIDRNTFQSFNFGDDLLWALSCDSDHILSPITEGISPDTKAEALAFAIALRITRGIDSESSFQDALYVEKISRLLPTFSISSKTADDIVLGYWLTGGARVSAKSFRRLKQMMSWLAPEHLKEIVETGGVAITEFIPADSSDDYFSQSVVPTADSDRSEDEAVRKAPSQKSFELAGRPELAAFFNEHIVDILVNRSRYKALGIEFPSAVVLYGPPGTGKTYAVQQLIDFLGWPSFEIDASNIASPFIHETSKKVANLFDEAMANAPSVLVIDEMEAFLADREMGSGHHRVEEVAEFLRRIPEAAKKDVLIIAMTNRIDLIDSAILRRGRFDHVIKVDYATEIEVRYLLENLLSSMPTAPDVDFQSLAHALAGRPLSDIAFVVREGARLAVRSGNDRIDQKSLITALHSAPARKQEGSQQRRIGFL